MTGHVPDVIRIWQQNSIPMMRRSIPDVLEMTAPQAEQAIGRDMTDKPGFFDLNDERGVLRTSIVVTLVISSLGIGFGLVSGSFSITFDGVYSLVDASMSLLSLIVVNLITSSAASSSLSRKLRERFSLGFWHLEPMVLGLNGTLLIGVAAYALVNAISSLLEGGRDLEFGWAIVYAAVTLIACATIAIVE